ncbi:unnamed protein product [Tuber melanosporum]|uniref:Ubiquitin fusion degradation protein 1 n=1 Tax=Tuber melanosporum (strain Mel28) TaxID=656061 RepID=D5GK37_TUBMM|nr:uncharacterized protein GSTUM_00009346001 [Tuber melanosporum]CAZ84880.1 unnamed protein product [Tuber melanosporum]
MVPSYHPRNRRFDEFLRCYPIVMMSGAERAELNFGGKVIMPPSALDKLSRLHIAYPMLFELRNGSKDKVTHAGVLEFIAEEGRVYLPHWMMKTLLLEPGELLQIKSTDLLAGTFIKLQPQSTAFITSITDPKAVLENALRTFSALTVGDVFSFFYNDQVFDIAVLEVKPETKMKAITTIETDISVDFAPPVGYVEPSRAPQPSRPGSVVGGRNITPLGETGSMARSINYAAIAPSGAVITAAPGAKQSFFAGGGGQKLKGSKANTPRDKPSTPVAGVSSNPPPLAIPAPTIRRGTGPQPLRLPPGQLFFGYEIKPVKKKDGGQGEKKESMFSGSGQTLRGGNAGGRKKRGDEAGKGKGKGLEVIEID